MRSPSNGFVFQLSSVVYYPPRSNLHPLLTNVVDENALLNAQLDISNSSVRTTPPSPRRLQTPSPSRHVLLTSVSGSTISSVLGKKVAIGGITGGLVGGVFVLSLTRLVALFSLRRRQLQSVTIPHSEGRENTGGVSKSSSSMREQNERQGLSACTSLRSGAPHPDFIFIRHRSQSRKVATSAHIARTAPSVSVGTKTSARESGPSSNRGAEPVLPASYWRVIEGREVRSLPNDCRRGMQRDEVVER